VQVKYKKSAFVCEVWNGVGAYRSKRDAEFGPGAGGCGWQTRRYTARNIKKICNFWCWLAN